MYVSIFLSRTRNSTAQLREEAKKSVSVRGVMNGEGEREREEKTTHWPISARDESEPRTGSKVRALSSANGGSPQHAPRRNNVDFANHR